MPRKSKQLFKNQNRKVSNLRSSNNVNRRNKNMTRGRMKGFNFNNKLRLSTSIEQTDLSDRTICNIAVSEAFSDDPGTFQNQYTFVANGLFNPLGSSGDGQPSWFKPWMAMYAKYRVVSSSIQLQCTNEWTTAMGVNTYYHPYEIVVYPSVSSTFPSTVVGAKTQPFAVSKLIGPATGSSNGTVFNLIAASKVFGRNVMGDENFSGDFGDNPNNKFYWQIYAETLYGTNIYSSFIATVRFRVIFYGRLPQDLTAPSLSALYTSHIQLNRKDKTTDLKKYKLKLLELLDQLDDSDEKSEEKIEIV